MSTVDIPNEVESKVKFYLPTNDEFNHLFEVEGTARDERAALKAQTELLADHVLKTALDEATELIATMRHAVERWKQAELKLDKLLKDFYERLLSELAKRPDLEMADFELSAISLQAVAKEIHTHDLKRENALNMVRKLEIEIANYQRDVEPWVQAEGDRLLENPFSEQHSVEMSLQELEVYRQELKQQRQQLKQTQRQIRELSTSRIISLLEELEDSHEVIAKLGLILDQEQVERNQVALQSKTGRELWDIEQQIQALLEQQMIAAHKIRPLPGAQLLQQGWHQAALMGLLSDLAKANRNVETVLLFLSIKQVHIPPTRLTFDANVSRAILLGIGELSEKSEPLQVTNQFADIIFNGWESADWYLQAEICIILLSLALYGNPRFEVERLWDIATDWPDQKMGEWKRLWEATLYEKLFQIADEKRADDLREQIESGKHKLQDELLIKESGVYLRLNAVKSARHRSMMQSSIMPLFDEWFAGLLDYERKFVDPTSLKEWQRTTITREYLALWETIQANLTEESLQELYSNKAHHSDVRDPDPFHKQTCERLMNNCGQALLDFGNAQAQWWSVSVESIGRFRLSDLRAEIERNLTELTPLGRAATEYFSSVPTEETSQRDDQIMVQRALATVEQALLETPVFCMRLPRTVDMLTHKEAQWSELLDSLLQDLLTPLTPVDAANYLLENDSPDQALLLANHIPTELQKRAQQLKVELSAELVHEIDNLSKWVEVLPPLERDRRLGRWRLLIDKLAALQTTEKQKAQQKAREKEAEQRTILRRINDLEEVFFGLQTKLSQTAYHTIVEGLDRARQAIREFIGVKSIIEFLDELDYRIAHESWSLGEYQAAVERLTVAIDMRNFQRDESEYTIERVHDMLINREHQHLGLREAFPTRIRFLDRLLIARQHRGFLSQNLSITKRKQIHDMFAQFAKMTYMQQSQDQHGEHYVFEDPIIYSYWKLIAPKTYELSVRDCIFIFVPGSQPDPTNMTLLEALIEEKEWLSHDFVFAFIPGCTVKMRQRLETTFARQPGLVVLDETEILDLVLAERMGASNPIGRLRPKMLNALGANDISIYTVTQLVREQNQIFVGRKRLIKQLLNSADNFAIYGGRRIGKSSVLAAVQDQLSALPDMNVVSYDFSGRAGTNVETVKNLVDLLGLTLEQESVDSFLRVIHEYLDENPQISICLLLDEIDRYIEVNERHLIVEAFRSLSDQYERRFRVIFAGFMSLYSCLRGNSHYQPTSDPWIRMVRDEGPLGNLQAANAEKIVKEGFREVLGWEFESDTIPLRIVEKTGGHPAFVQYFCSRLQKLVGERGSQKITFADVEAVFSDQHPEQSFMAHVGANLKMNLPDPLSRFLIYWLANEPVNAQGFTLAQIKEYASLSPVPIDDVLLHSSIELLKVNSVIKEERHHVYEFSVPDYPAILKQVGETDQDHLNMLELELKEYLENNA